MGLNISQYRGANSTATTVCTSMSTRRLLTWAWATHRSKTISRARLEYGLRFNPRNASWATPFRDADARWSVFGGVSFNHLWTDGNPRLVGPESGNDGEWGHDLFVWPGFFFGMRYGR